MNTPKIVVLTANTMEVFVAELNKQVEQGWAPQGSPVVFEGRINIMLLKIPEEDLATRL